MKCDFGSDIDLYASKSFKCQSPKLICSHHYSDVIVIAMASQITSLTSVYSTVYWGTDQRKYQSSESLVFGRGTHRWLVNSEHKWPVTRKMFQFNDVIVLTYTAFRPVRVLSVNWNQTILTQITLHVLRAFDARSGGFPYNEHIFDKV